MVDNIFRYDKLRKLINRILILAGASDSNADIAATHIATSNLCGVDSHGARQVPGYVEDIKHLFLLPAADPKVIQKSNGALLVSGSWTFGHVAAEFALKKGIKELDNAAIVLVGLVQCGHLGRVGHYAEMAAAAGVIAIICSGGHGVGTPLTAPYGGRERVFNTNPISFAAPCTEGNVVGDFATTAGANAKVRMAADQGKPLPTGFGIDNDGNPTTNPTAVVKGGALLPFGGHKGYALMTLIEILTRILMGSDYYADEIHGGPTYGHQGVCMLLLRPDVFHPESDYQRAISELSASLRMVQPAPGFLEVLVPGDPERRAREDRLRDGIPLPQNVWSELEELADKLAASS